MKFGIFPKEGGSFDGMVEEARTAEDVGFASCWVCEHHAGGENYWPAPLVRLAGLATVTDDLELVTAVLIPALHNAVGLAEECATVDQLSNGRLTVGLGLGYVSEEFDAFGVPMADRGGRFVESLRLLDEYLSSTDPITFRGEFWSFEDLQPNPTTVQQPRPPLWVGGWGDLALQRSVRFGDAWVPGGTANLDQLAERQAKLREYVDRAGESWNDRDHPLMREVIVAETSERAAELSETYLARSYREEYGSEEWSHPLIREENPEDLRALAADRFLVGTPSEVAAGIERFQERIDVDQVGCRFHHPGMSHELVQRQIELFGDEVIPAVA